MAKKLKLTKAPPRITVGPGASLLRRKAPLETTNQTMNKLLRPARGKGKGARGD